MTVKKKSVKKAAKAQVRKKAIKKAAASRKKSVREYSPGRSDFMRLPEADLSRLASKLDDLNDVLAEPDVKQIESEFEAARPKERVIDEAVSLAMEAYQQELGEQRAGKPSPLDLYLMRGKLESDIRDNFDDMKIDEDAVRYNVERADFSTCLHDDRFYVIQNGTIAAALEDARDSRGLSWAIVSKITSIVIESVGLIVGIRGIRAKPDPNKVGRLMMKCMNNRTFWNETKLFFAFWSQYADIMRRSHALLRWIKALYDTVKKLGELRELARAFVAGYKWYQIASMIAQFIASLVAMVVTAGSAIAAKVALCLIQLAALAFKVIELARLTGWRAARVTA